MKARKFTTGAGAFFAETELRPAAGEMNGALTVQTVGEPQKDPVIGFGVALTGSSCYELNAMSPEQRDAFLEDIYGEQGLGLSVGRVTVGASDYSAELYTYDDAAGDTELKQFSVERDEEYILPMLREVLAKRPDLFVYASPWSPPGWMKTGGSICGGYMREKYLDAYADYYVKFLQEYEKRGVPIRALTPQNEPETDQGGKMPACIWHPEIEARFVLTLRRKLDEAGLSQGIWLYDHNYSGWRRILWQLKEYPELLKASGSAAFHYYMGGAELMEEIRKEYPEMRFHFTEGGPRLFSHYEDDWCKWSMVMAQALKHGCRTFCGWNLLLDENGGPNIGPFSCAGLATLNSRTGQLTYSGQYRAMKHFASTIKRGALICNTELKYTDNNLSGDLSGKRQVEVCAAVNPDGSHVLQLANPTGEKAQVQYRYGGQWWYVELLPDTIATVCFEE